MYVLYREVVVVVVSSVCARGRVCVVLVVRSTPLLHRRCALIQCNTLAHRQESKQPVSKLINSEIEIETEKVKAKKRGILPSTQTSTSTTTEKTIKGIQYKVRNAKQSIIVNAARQPQPAHQVKRLPKPKTTKPRRN